MLRVRSEVSGYQDTMNVAVLSPALDVSVEQPTERWMVGASTLVDIVSAASVDIAATASPRWREVRTEGALRGEAHLGTVAVGASVNGSVEPDYRSTSFALRAGVELRQQTLLPTFTWSWSHDINAKTDTPRSIFAKHLDRHAVGLGLGLVLTSATILSVDGSFVFEDGDPSKPYRHIPMFDPSVAPLVRPGETVDSVNLHRLSARPLERLPDSRMRGVLTGSFAHRFRASTLRVRQRLATDSWEQRSSTTDVRFLADLSSAVRAGPHLRVHAQTGTHFHRLAYAASELPDGSVRLPRYRTGDRELGPLLSTGLGAQVRYAFGTLRRYGLSLDLEAIHTRFERALYVKDRWAAFAALGFEGAVE